MSILLNVIFSKCVFDIIISIAAPVESPEVKNSGPNNAVFHRGLALNADNKIPV